MNAAKNPYVGYRYPADIISHAVWLYFRFTLSDRDVEELLAARDIVVTYETVRPWCLTFGQAFAHELRRRAPRRGDKWPLDEVYLNMNGRRHYLWRAVDQDGYVHNRAELSHQPTRQRERPMRRFKSPGHAQRFLSAQGPINNLFRPRRHRMTATEYRATRKQAFETWQQVTCAQRTPLARRQHTMTG